MLTFILSVIEILFFNMIFFLTDVAINFIVLDTDQIQQNRIKLELQSRYDP